MRLKSIRKTLILFLIILNVVWELGFKNVADLSNDMYDDGEPGWSPAKFEQEMLDLWEELRPYYNKLHAYVRMKLRKLPEYADKIKPGGPIPIHLTGAYYPVMGNFRKSKFGFPISRKFWKSVEICKNSPKY